MLMSPTHSIHEIGITAAESKKQTHTTPSPMTNPVEKAQAAHIEGTGADVLAGVEVDGYVSNGLVKSRFDQLSIPRTVWVFKRVVLIILAVYTGYVCEGFEVSQRPGFWSR